VDTLLPGSLTPLSRTMLQRVMHSSAAPPRPPPRASLRALLTSADAQDALVDSMVAAADGAWRRLGAQATKARWRICGAPSPEEASPADEIGVDEEAGSWAGAAAPPVVTNPFSKLIVTGWPADEAECSVLLRFVRSVEAESLRRESLDGSRAGPSPLQQKSFQLTQLGILGLAAVPEDADVDVTATPALAKEERTPRVVRDDESVADSAASVGSLVP
jgi:hypothetical protein